MQGVDATTGGIKSGVTWTVRRCIDGTFAAGGGTVTEDGTTGWYKFAMSQADTNGNNIGFNFTGTGAIPQTVNIITDGSPPDVNLKNAAGTAVTLDANNVLNVSAKYLAGTALTARDIGASVLLSAGTGTGQLDFTSGVVKSNPVQWLGGTIPAVNVTGVPLVDLKYTLGTISPATAGSVRCDAVTGAVGSVTGAVGSVTARVTANTDQLNGDATSAANIAKTTRAIARGTVTTGASTTSIPTSAMTPAGAAADQFKGRIVTFDADTTTTALRGQSTDITASSNSATPTLTVTALTTAPASGDTFSVT